MNNIFNFFPLKLDSVEDYIPPAQAISRAIVTGEILDPASWTVFMDKFIGYTFPLAIIFSLTGNSIVAGSFLAAIFGALTIYTIHNFTKELFGKDTATLTALLLVFSPFYVFISSAILRDTMVLFFIVWFYRLWQLHDKDPSRRNKLLMTFALGYAGILRPPIMLVMVASALFYKLFIDEGAKKSYRRYLLKYLKLIFVLIGLIIFVGIIQGTINTKTIGDFWMLSGFKLMDMDKINERNAVSSEAVSSYYPQLKYEGPMDIITTLPYLALYFMCSPFPWDVTKMSMALALLDSMMLWLLYLFFIPQIRSFIRQDKKWASILFSYLFMGIFSSAMVQTNMGAAQRHRVMFTIFIIPLAAHQMVLLWKGKRRRVKRQKLVRSPVSFRSA
jgi:4-amino-4-deoxy-L-arabinose transferase-like glycosyltransferase